VSTFAAAVARGQTGWAASEIELSGLADIDEVADRLLDAEPEAEVSLLFVESDDQYLVILRLDEGEDLRVFGSDSAFAEESRLGALLLGDIEAPTLDLDDVAPVTADAVEAADDDDEDPPVADPDADPVGDTEILADLGVSSSRLLALCAQEGLMPSDVTSSVAEKLGCADELEELREA
jgi:putative tRNA adenosine deaminase-associated protein